MGRVVVKVGIGVDNDFGLMVWFLVEDKVGVFSVGIKVVLFIEESFVKIGVFDGF